MNIYSITRYGKYLQNFETFERLPLIKGCSRLILGENEDDAIRNFKDFLKEVEESEKKEYYEYEAKKIGYLDYGFAYDLNGKEMED